ALLGRYEWSFESSDNISQADGSRRSRERIAAAGPTIAAHQRRSPQRQEQLLEVRLGDALSLSNLSGVDRSLAVPAGDLDHGVGRVVGALRKAHLSWGRF